MFLDRVTITGADDSIDPNQLAELSAEFPYAEWGILVSLRQEGSPRFPSIQWQAALRGVLSRNPEMKLSLHVCGQWVRDILAGTCSIALDRGGILEGFPRVQLNFHAETLSYDPTGFGRVLEDELRDKQVIFQIDGTRNNRMFDFARGLGVDAVPLFDTSGGAGVVPDSWPQATYTTVDQRPPDGLHVRSLIYHGYAGGLGPDTLEAQLPRIAEAAGEARIWVDMEGRVRSRVAHGEDVFDLAKVRRCLEICRGWVRQPANV